MLSRPILVGARGIGLGECNAPSDCVGRLLSFVLAMLTAFTAQAQERVALVIGNGAYQSATRFAQSVE